MTGGDGSRIVIVKRVKKVEGGHHGGSWKVAYADFVTAMMAFFLVMWIMGMDEGVKELVEGYFSNPIGFHQSFSGGTNPLSAGTSPVDYGMRAGLILTRERQTDLFETAAEQIEEQVGEGGIIGEMPAEVEVVVTDDGLRIELMETGGAETFFDRSSASLKPALEAVLGVIAGELQALPNAVVIEGHTDALRFGGPNYTNWELSGDRANAARRLLLAHGLDERRIAEVRGYADRVLKVPEEPLSARNRRITVLLPYQDGLVDVRSILPSAVGNLVGGGGGGGPPSLLDLN